MKSNFKIIMVFLMFSTLLCAKSINVAVAANVSYALNDLKKEFNKQYPDIKVKVTLGSSGKLTAQITHGAPYELFMSANMKYPNALFKQKIALAKPIVYARGAIAMLSGKKFDFSQGIKLVKNKNIEKIAIANPKTAPYGKAAIQALDNAKLLKDVKNKFVYAESISAAVAYSINAADLGFVAKSSLFSPKMKRFKEGVNWAEVDKSLYTPIDQGIVILKNGEKSKEVKAFYDFILSKKAKKIFEKYGYAI
ncbi:molybdate ABC transporter substrate-binding protein [Sulfurospirillum sp. 1307]|jgi:molybdate transport system substrate-binding protein